MIYFYLFCLSLGFLTFTLLKRRDLAPAAVVLMLGLGLGLMMQFQIYHWMSTA